MSTGVGSMPGTDPAWAATLICGELDLAHVPELPGRGVGADMVGRAPLLDLPIDTALSGEYRLAARPGRVTRLAAQYRRDDGEAFAHAFAAAGRHDTRVKVQSIGPFTLAATLSLPNGHKVIHDVGAWRDVAASLLAGIGELVADTERHTGARVVVQLDEPMLRPVVLGHVPPLTRLDVNPPVPAETVASVFADYRQRLDRELVLHDCSSHIVWDTLQHTSFGALSTDVSLLNGHELDLLGEFLDKGNQWYAGVSGATVDAMVDPLVAVIDRIGIPRSVLIDQVVITPPCGLAGLPPPQVSPLLQRITQAQEALARRVD